MRKQHEQCRWNAGDQRRRGRACRWRKTRKRYLHGSKMPRSSSCWLKWRRRQKGELTWTDQERKRRRRENRSLRTRVSSAPDTRKILFHSVTSFVHKARTWLLSDQVEYDIMGVAEHDLDVSSAAEEAGRLRAGGYCSIWTGRGGTSGRTMAMIKPHWKFSRFLHGYGDLAEPLKRWDWTPNFFGI